MKDDFIDSVVEVVTAIVGVAIIAKAVRDRRDTEDVIAGRTFCPMWPESPANERLERIQERAKGGRPKWGSEAIII